MNDYSELKRLAEETKGWDKLTDAWVSEEDIDETDADLRDWVVGRIDEDGNPYPVATVCTWQYDAPGDAQKLAKYYAAANPAAVLALIAENERLKKFEEWFGRLETGNNSLVESFKAESEALRKDAERYRWLRQDDVEQCRISRQFSEDRMDTEIDAAMGKGASNG